MKYFHVVLGVLLCVSLTTIVNAQVDEEEEVYQNEEDLSYRNYEPANEVEERGLLSTAVKIPGQIISKLSGASGMLFGKSNNVLGLICGVLTKILKCGWTFVSEIFKHVEGEGIIGKIFRIKKQFIKCLADCK